MAPIERISVGMLGLGTVGAEVFELLHDKRTLARSPVPARVTRIAVANPEKARTLPASGVVVTGNVWDVVEAPDVDIIVEVMGGVEPARRCLVRALQLGKAVVTANKQVMSQAASEIFAAAEASGVPVRFEGSVGGGIPLVKPLQESLAAASITSITGILNGTTNYILTRMERDGAALSEALDEAQARGFAEANPTEDLDGSDAAAKLAILTSVAFHVPVSIDDVFREGIGAITFQDIAHARELGFAVKLLAVSKIRDGMVEARVHPALIPLDHPLARVPDEFNAVLVEGDGIGQVVFSGRGAGGPPTAVSVVGDILDVARELAAGNRSVPHFYPAVDNSLSMRPMEDVVLPYYFGLLVVDRPGVFARVAAAFGEEQVSIASIVQKSRGQTADVVLLTHDTPERLVRKVIARLKAMDVVAQVRAAIRVEGTL